MSIFPKMLIQLAWRNIWRNKRRTLITMASVVFAVVLAVLLNSVKEGILVKMQENAVSFYSGALQFQNPEYWEDKTLDNIFRYDSTIIEQLEGDEEITAIAPRLESFALAAADERSKAAMILGIDPELENDLSALESKLIKGNYLSSKDNSVMLSEGLADYLELGVSDTLVLLGQGYHGVSAAGKYAVSGILKIASPELNKRLVYLPLNSAQELFGAYDMVSSVVLNLDDVEDAGYYKERLNTEFSELSVLSWKDMMPELDQMIEAERAETAIFLFVLYLLISFGIFGTILMMLMERQYEFGVLLSIGMRRLQLARVVIMENVMITVSGAIVGTLLSVPAVIYFHKFPIEVGGKLKEAYENFGFEPIFYFSVDPPIFYSQALVVLIIALILSMFPVFKIMRLDPIQAMRN